MSASQSSGGGMDPEISAESGLKQRAVRGWAVNMGSQGAKFFIQMAMTVIMARLLTPDDFGKVTMVSSLLGFVLLFKDMGLSMATVQKEKITHQEITGLFWINVVAGFAIMLVMMACAPLVVWFYGENDLLWIAIAFAAIAPISSLGAQHSALLNRQMRFMGLAIRDQVSLVVGAIVGVIAAWKGMGVWSLVMMQATTAITDCVTLWWLSGWRPGPPKWNDNLKPLLLFGGKLTATSLVAYFSKNLDSILLGQYHGSAAVGVYGRAQGLMAKPMTQVMRPLMASVIPAFARVSTDYSKLERAIVQLLGIVACGSCLLMAVAIGSADWIVDILLGHQWAEVAGIFSVLGLLGFFEPCSSLMWNAMAACGHAGKLLRWQIFSTSLVVAGILVGLPWGALGVATGFATSALLIRAPLMIWYSARAIGISPAALYRAVYPFVTIGLAVAAGAVWLRKFWEPVSAWTGLIVFSLVASMVYAGIVFALPQCRKTVLEAFKLSSLLGSHKK